MKSNLMCVALMAFLSTSPSESNAQQSSYWFRKVADSNRSFSEFYPPAINNQQMVAFTAVQKSGDVGVFTVNYGEFKTVIRSGGERRGVTINEAGMVCFSREFNSDGSGGGLFTSVSGKVSTVMSAGFVTDWSSNNRGNIALNLNFDFEDNALYLYRNGRLTQIPNSQYGDDPQLTASDTVLFIRREIERGRLYISRGGQRPELLIDTQSGPMAEILIAVMNNNGIIALSGSEDSGGNKRGPRGIFMLNNGKLTKYVDSTGPFSGLFYSLAINNSGRIAFTAILDAGAEGIFTGPDPVQDKVIAVGDALFGSTVTDLDFGSEGLNDNDVLAFRATLADGRQILALAYPRVN